jgi:hypothetical protein
MESRPSGVNRPFVHVGHVTAAQDVYPYDERSRSLSSVAEPPFVLSTALLMRRGGAALSTSGSLANGTDKHDCRILQSRRQE